MTQPASRARMLASGLTVALFAGLFLAPAASAKPQPTSSPSVVVRGWAYLGTPVVGATVVVDGEGPGRHDRVKTTTDEHGTFAVRGAVGSTFHVTVKGGTVNGAPLDGRLESEVVDYGTTTQIVNVDEVTTLAARYSDRHPHQSEAQVEAKVAAFLLLSPTLSVAGDLHNPDASFSHATFASEAQSSGGIQPLLRQLAREMDTPQATHSFKSNLLQGIGAAAAGGFVNGIISKLSSTATGYVLNELGLGDPVQQEILDTLHQVSTALNQLQASVNQIMQMLTQQSYDQWATSVFPIVSIVQQAWTNYTYLADAGPAQNQTEKDSQAGLKSILMSQINLLISNNYMLTLQGSLSGQSSTTGAYLAWSNLVRSKTPLMSPTSSQQLVDYFNYYDTIEWQLAQLIREGYAENKITQDAYNATVFSPYSTERTKQLNRFTVLKTLSTDVIDTRSSTMWPLGVGGYGPQIRCRDTGVRYAPCGAPFGVQDTVNAINAKALDGYNDWRQPSISELQNLPMTSDPRGWLVGVTNAPDMFKSCDASGCTYWVWSSTSANGGKPCGAYWAWNAGNAWETKGINGCEKATVWVNRTVSAADIDQYWLKPA